MTQEQFDKAMKANDRIRELEEVKAHIKGTDKRRLFYAWKGDTDYRVCPQWAMRTIADILDKHDKMIRQEIDDEIERLKKEIEEL